MLTGESKKKSDIGTVILLSGGLDSSANLAIESEKSRNILALTLDYGQRSALREIEASQKLAAYFGARHEVVPLRWLGELGGSSLTQESIRIPEPETADLDNAEKSRESARAVWVPNRNGVFVNVAGAWAEALGARRVLAGFNREEAETFPDNSSEFMKQVNRGFGYSIRSEVRLKSHTVEMTKKEIVAAIRLLERPFPFEMLWSCYRGGEGPCKICESCRRLTRAMGEAPVRIDRVEMEQ